jgi:ABC-type lipoprotein export system ATPase subunit
MRLSVDGLRHTYQSRGIEARTVLDVAGWQVEAGEQVLLRGISGSGKTTLLNIVAGLLHPSAGRVSLGNQSMYALNEAQRDRFRAQQIGYVFQMHHLAPSLTALENVEMPAVFARQGTAAERRTLAADLLGKLGLDEFTRHRPAQLSTGQRLRVTVARALVNRPSLVLADEPTAALDPSAGETVIDLLQTMCAKQGATLIVASHDPTLNVRFTRVVDLHNGRLQEDESRITMA